MINGEFGNILRIQAEEAIVNNTNSILLRSSSPYIAEKVFTVADGVITPTFSFVADGITFLGNQYVEYVLKEGDITISGEWTACLFSLNPEGENKILGPLTFTVDEC